MLGTTPHEARERDKEVKSKGRILYLARTWRATFLLLHQSMAKGYVSHSHAHRKPFQETKLPTGLPHASYLISVSAVQERVEAPTE